MFCPNCGTQNDSSATPCKKCGYKLSSVSLPKFKGTMMLNSDQTVQDVIDEHRRKQDRDAAPAQEGGPSEAAPRAPGAGATPASPGGTRAPVLQPPRVAPRGRMGGTMLGVAPQVGGYAPAAGSFPRPTSPATASGATAEAAPLPPPPVAESTPTGPEAAAPLQTSGSRPHQPVAALPDPVAENASPVPAGARGERDRLPVEEASPDRTPASEPDPSMESPGEAEEAEPRRVAVTAPLPAQPERAKPASAAPRLRPLDIVLIIFTFGVYGIVLWARQRKPSA